MITVKIPGPFRQDSGGKSEVDVEGRTVREALENLIQKFPGLGKIMRGGEVIRQVNVYLGDEDVRHLGGIGVVIVDEREISLVPAIAGGA